MADGASDAAWKIHDALDSWIGKVDVKASIVLAVEAAMLALVGVLSASGNVLSRLHGGHQFADVVGIVLLALASLFSLAAVYPQLGPKRTGDDRGIVYFGDLRGRHVDEVTSLLSDGFPTNQEVARQLVVMASVSWSKHRLLQASIICLTSSIVAFGAAVIH